MVSAGLDYYKHLPRPLLDPQSRTRKRPDLCAAHGHPGVTYNPWMHKTWCLCGEVIREGMRVETPHAACCGGPLEEEI